MNLIVLIAPVPPPRATPGPRFGDWHLFLLFIVTKDNDFLARALVRGHPPQVVQVCVGNASTGQIAAILRDRLDSIEAFVGTATESVFLLRGAEPS